MVVGYTMGCPICSRCPSAGVEVEVVILVEYTPPGVEVGHAGHV